MVYESTQEEIGAPGGPCCKSQEWEEGGLWALRFLEGKEKLPSRSLRPQREEVLGEGLLGAMLSLFQSSVKGSGLAMGSCFPGRDAKVGNGLGWGKRRIPAMVVDLGIRIKELLGSSMRDY